MARLFRLLVLVSFSISITSNVIGMPGQFSSTAQAAATSIDLIADSIEVTQTVQDLNNSVRLVAGKRTFVRVYAHSANTSYLTIAQLVLQKGSSTQTIYPVAPGGPGIYVRAIYNRLLPSHAFLFELPSAFTSGTVNLYATINPVTSWRPLPNPVEINYGNNVVSTQVSFESVPSVRIAIGSQPYSFNNITYAPTFFDRWMMFKWLTRVYPAGNFKLKLFTLPQVTAQRKFDDPGYKLTYPSCNWLISYLYVYKVFPTWGGFINAGISPDSYIHWYGMVADVAGFMRGCGLDTIQTASGPTGPWDQGWDFDGTYGDWYGGHELAHTYSRDHTLGGPNIPKDDCGDESKGGTTVKQYAYGRISPTTDVFSSLAMFGFDSRAFDLKQNPILSPGWRDVMTYCDYQWISDKTYEGLMSHFQNTLPAAPVPVSISLALADRLSVTGTLFPMSQTGELYPGSIFTQVEDTEPRIPGPFSIVLSDSDGSELARYPFTPDLSITGPDPYSQSSEELLVISELVPYVSQTTQVAIEGPGGAIWVSKAAGSTFPSIQILTPAAGENIDIGDMFVSWLANDEDGDPVTVNVEYSLDNGLSWELVGLYLEGNQVIIPADNLPTSSQALVRLTASDGIHSSSSVMEGPFIVPNHEPVVQIDSPSDGAVIAAEQTLTLEGFAYDFDLGFLDGAFLSWSSDIDGALGNGASLVVTNLSPAYHTITLTADDGQGGIASDTVDVNVVPTPDDLPALPDGLLVEPQLILLEPGENLSSAVISMENQNPAIISWSLSAADQPWVLLSDSSGSTPQDIMLSLDMSYLKLGTYIANLTFTSPDLRQEKTVRVVVLMPEYNMVLPMIMR